MTDFLIDDFRGRLPRVSARALPGGYAQIATSPRLLSSDLESWAERAQVGTLAKAKPINTIFQPAARIAGSARYWLQWTQAELDAFETNVDVAFGPIPGDTAEAVFFTGAGGPRYTNRSLATDPIYQGTAADGAYPYKSLPLGISPPTTAPTVAQSIPQVAPGMNSFSFDGSDISGWTIGEGDNGEFNDGLTQRNWGVDAGTGFYGSSGPGYPLPAFRGICARSDHILMQRDFKLDESIAFDYSFDYYLDAVSPSGDFGGFTHRFLSSDTVGPSVFHQSNGTVIFSEGTGSFQTYNATGLAITTKYTMRVVATLGTDGYFDVTVQWKVGTAIVYSVSGRASPAGGKLGFEITSRKSQQSPRQMSWDNLVGNVTQTPPAQPAPVYADYLYTIVNSLGQESAPSPVSDTVTVDNGITNTITIGAQPAGVDVVTVRLYRAGNSTTAAQYLLVDELRPPFPIVYVDSKTSNQLGPDVLVTGEFDPPPANLRGLLALPNGVLVGFAGNQVCFSEPDYPYAWPVRYRLTTDYPIVAIGAVDTTVIVLTQAFPYIALGSTPGAYAMGKGDYQQSCIGKRSLAYLPGFGVLYASPDGLYAINGPGAPRNVTQNLFTQREWRALNPASIIGAVHDDRYFGFYDATSIGGSKGGFMIDFREGAQGGFGLIDLPDHATAVYADPIDDTLYMVVDDTYPVP